MPHKWMGVWWPLFQEPSRKLRVKGFRRMQGNIRPIAKPIVEAVPKLVKRIQHDKVNFDTPDALENEVLEIMAATINGDFCSNCYPRIRPTEANLRRYGITSRNPRIAFIQVLISTVKDTFKAIISRNIKDAAITEKWARLTSGQIARKYVYNKGRQRSQGRPDDFNARFVNREVRLDASDTATTTDIDRIEMLEIYNQGLAIYRRAEKADQLVMYTNQLFATQGLSWEAAYRQLESEYRKVGITTCRGAKKRRDSLPQRYPDLKLIKDALQIKDALEK